MTPYRIPGLIRPASDFSRIQNLPDLVIILMTLVYVGAGLTCLAGLLGVSGLIVAIYFSVWMWALWNAIRALMV